MKTVKMNNTNVSQTHWEKQNTPSKNEVSPENAYLKARQLAKREAKRLKSKGATFK